MSSLRDILKDVPQSAKHHIEGTVWKHIRLVRCALPIAEGMFEEERRKGPPFSDYGHITEYERKLLRAAAWLHDVGKASTTAWTHPDGSKTPWQELGVKLPDDGGRLQSLQHEEPDYYEPVLRQLGIVWQGMYEKTSPEDRDILRFLVDEHMGFVGEKVSRGFVHVLMDDRGVLRSDTRVKLLIVFKLMDVIGRGSMMVEEGREFLAEISRATERRRRFWAAQLEKNAPVSREDFVLKLRAKGLTDALIQQAAKGKYGE
jgi:hypothetical protein